MNYEEALKRWGAIKLEDKNKLPRGTLSPENINVYTEFDGGYSCCGGADPNCYCSFYEFPSANVIIRDNVSEYSMFIDFEDFDFMTILREIIEVAEGNITLKDN